MTAFGATILGCEGLSLGPEEKTFFQQVDPFGFILFARNIDNLEQIRALCAELRDTVGRDAPILIDQEGGRVQRLRPPLARDWPAPLDQVEKAGERAAEVMRLRYHIIAAELRALGIDCNCAPMVDVAEAATHPFLRNRCYGSDPAQVAAIGRAVADGLFAGGVLPVLKHIPGHGRARADSHLELPRVDAPLSALDAHDFAPFRALNDLPLGMTAHLVYSAIDELAATISARVMTLIRERIGFDGLIMTDDISMKALSAQLPARCTASLEAGCDVILHCNGDLAEMREIAGAAGRMNPRAQARAEAALAARPAPVPVDIAALEAQLQALI